jgi:hypothetical protein
VNTIEDVLRELGIRHAGPGESKHVTPGWTGIRCPYCDDGQGNYGMGLRVSSTGWVAASCWKCGKRNAAEVLALASGGIPRHSSQNGPRIDYHRVVALLHTLGKIIDPEARQEPLKACRPPAGVGELLPIHKRYLTSRGLDPDEVSEVWGVRGIGQQSKLSWRLFIPATLDKKVVSWTSRSVVGKSYVSCPREDEQYPIKQVLYGEDLILYGNDLRQSCTAHAVVLVEGPLDAWAIGPGAVATMGVRVSQVQLARASKYPVRVICMDSDNRKTVKLGQSLARKLADFPGKTYSVVLRTGKDPSRASKKELSELRRRFLT